MMTEAEIKAILTKKWTWCIITTHIQVTVLAECCYDSVWNSLHVKLRQVNPPCPNTFSFRANEILAISVIGDQSK